MATNHLMASSQLFVAKLSVYVILQLQELVTKFLTEDVASIKLDTDADSDGDILAVSYLHCQFDNPQCDHIRDSGLMISCCRQQAIIVYNVL